MLGLFRRKLRNDQLKLLSANLQMARALGKSYRMGMRLGLEDADCPDLAGAFKAALSASLAAATYLDQHDHLSLNLAEEQLEIYQALKPHLDAHEAGRAAVQTRPMAAAGRSAVQVS